MKRNSKLFLKDIIDSMNDIEKFVDNMSLQELKRDKKTLNAVIRSLEIIGEATKNIPKEIKLKHKEIPWKEMAGMRDVLIHAYFGIDYNLLWTAIKKNIPEIKPKIKKILKEVE